MLTRLIIRNFKQLDEAILELGKAVVLIGPNNSGKTSALQALTLWDVGIKKWQAKREDKDRPEKRPGVAINRRDLFAIPVPSAKLLWRDLHVRNVRRGPDNRQVTRNARIDVIAEGVNDGTPWSCGFEFDYTNEESFVCRPIRKSGFEEMPVGETEFAEVPDVIAGIRVAYLPPMSGLADREFLKQPGEIGFFIGQGQTAQVLRNLCHQVFSQNAQGWDALSGHIRRLFGAELFSPEFNQDSAEILLEYRDIKSGSRLDISSSGRGLQQTLLLLAYLHANPKTILLLDEPDAHLEILRQRQIFTLLTEAADTQGSQIIAASHSEVVLNEAVSRGRVIAFVGKPHIINDRGSQVLKALTDIGFEDYYQAEQIGWVLYLEEATDLAILQVFAELLDHQPAREALAEPFVCYLSTNVPQRARDHFYGLREALPNLPGVALFDRLDKELAKGTPLVETMWRRREIENYFCTEAVLQAYASGEAPDDLFSLDQRTKREKAMLEAIQEVSSALKTLNKPEPWSADIKATDDFLDPLFRAFFKKLSLPLALRKSDYYTLARLIPKDKLDSEVHEKLDLIASVAAKAKEDRGS
jgi:ABC-type transport system involved in cytochrome c biogenesis ATPase subunit